MVALMKVPTWEKLLGLISWMADAGGVSRCFGGVIGAQPFNVQRFWLWMAQIRELMRHILHVLCDQVNNLAFALQITGDTQEPAPHDDPAKALVYFGPNHHIADTGLVLKGEKNDT